MDPLVSSDGIRLLPPTWIASIDFGTRGSGFAISRAAAPAGTPPVLHESWPEQPEVRYPKDLTAILYRHRAPVAIGWSARNQWLALDEVARQNHTYLESFKLAIQDPARAAALPSWLDAEQVTGDYLSLLRAYAMDVFDDLYGEEGAPPSEDTIQWCLTVPAMWSEASKQIMRSAALRAGLITSFSSPRLILILEPEAAALHALVHRAPPLTAGMTVMVVDAGGGTTDVTVHACRDVGGQAVLEEPVATEGSICGGVMVDEAFRGYLRRYIGEAIFDTWAAERPREVAAVMDQWEAIKCAFNAGVNQVFQIAKPPHLAHLMMSADEEASSAPDLLITTSSITNIFTGTVQGVVDLAVRQLLALHRAGCELSMILLVGGFARSSYLQEHMRRTLRGYGIGPSKLVVPPLPHAAVLNGAVVYGSNPSFIHARRSRYTYGIKYSTPWVSDAPDKHWMQDLQQFYTHKAFMTYVCKGQQVASGQVVQYGYYPLSHEQETVTFPLMVSEHPCIRFVLDHDQDTHQAAVVTVTLPTPLPPGCTSALDLKLTAELVFGGTEVTVRAWEHTSNTPVAATIKFAAA